VLATTEEFLLRRVDLRRSAIALLCGFGLAGLVLPLVLQVGSPTTAVPNADDSPSGRIMVAYRDASPGASSRQTLAVRDAKLARLDSKTGIAVYEVTAGTEKEKAAEFASNAAVRVAEPDSRTSIHMVPNDAAYNQQWAPAKINAPLGWEVSTGSPSITLALLDTGIDLTNPDFAGRVVPGYNFIAQNTNVQDDHGHGTHVAGIAAATGNNGVGIAGMSWGVSIMSVKVLSASGGGYVSDLISGLDWARDHGAKIINISLGTPQTSELLQEAVQRALDAGILVIASAGNSGQSGNAPSYPAAFPGVIAVGATDKDDAKASYSTSGSYVSISAPGTGIYSTYPGGFATMSGTSMAAPHVSGMASVIWSKSPDLKASDVWETIRSTAVDLGAPGTDNDFGAGRIDFTGWAKQFGATLSTPTPTPSPTPTPIPSPTPTTPPASAAGGGSTGGQVFLPGALINVRNSG
jgi:subtilisin family serine protease